MKEVGSGFTVPLGSELTLAPTVSSKQICKIFGN